VAAQLAPGHGPQDVLVLGGAVHRAGPVVTSDAVGDVAGDLDDGEPGHEDVDRQADFDPPAVGQGHRLLIGLTTQASLTGQRRSQSDTRSELNFEELDHSRNIAKFNPIFDWEENDVWAYAQAYDVPLNALYFQGYPSIGCEPCTRPVKADEDIRAGRWWWESKDSKECGLHK